MNCISNRLDDIDYHFPFMPEFPTWENVDFQEIEKHFPFIEDMANCQQDPRFHSEGDVWTHTKMVIKELMQDDKWQYLDKNRQSVLFMTALFHDMAKPLVTVEEDGRITSKKHAVIGARKMRELMWRSDMKGHFKAPWQIREMVADMIMLHSLPVHFLDKRIPEFNVHASSMVLENWILGKFCEADMKGRKYQFNSERKDSLVMIKMFEDYIDELHCTDISKTFPSDNCRIRYFFERKGDHRFDYYEEIKGTVTMVAGVQGSGKSYTLNDLGLPIVGIDESRESLKLKYGKNEGTVLQRTKEHCKELMRDKRDFAFNATNCIKDVRRKWICLFRDYGYKVNCHYVEKPMVTTLDQNKNREKVIPEESILGKFAKLDFPTGLEFHDVVYNIENE